MIDGFEWDPLKAAINAIKHGVTFEEAATIFVDVLALTVLDPDRSDNEDRFITTAMSFRNRILTVVHTEREKRIRIISARKATARERRAYAAI